MIRVMDNKETKYVRILNKNNQINISPIIPRFCTVQRFLTASEIMICLNKGAQLSEVIGDKLIPINEKNYNLINEKDTTIITETPKTENIETDHVVKKVVVPEEEIIEPVIKEETKVEEVDEETVNELVEEEFDEDIEIE